jgi:hypothetical protein
MANRLLSLPIITVACLLLIVTGSGNASVGNIKDFLDTCPKNDPAYSQIKSNFTIRHNGVPVVMDNIACSEPVSSMPIAQFTNELIILQSLRVMYYMDYGQSGHLPWTAGSLYQWMKSKISGINIQDGAGANSCCDYTWGSPPYFTYQPQDDQQRAYKRQWKSLSGTISLFAHEIRHVDGFPHPSCCVYPRCDQTFDPNNLSCIAIQWWLNKLWLTGEINVGAACLDPVEKQDTVNWHLNGTNGEINSFCDNKPPTLTVPANALGPCLAYHPTPWKSQTIDSANDYGQHASLAIDPRNDIPFISYYDATSGHLRLASPATTGGNCGPDNSWFCQTVDSSPSVGIYSSIGISPPGPSRELGISYVDESSHTLKYYYDYCPFLGLCHRVIETVDSGLNPPYYTSLKFDSTGTPHIAYLGSCGANCSRLKYATWVGSGGNCGTGNHWKCEQVDAVTNANYPSLDLDKSNRPRIAYYNAQSGDLRYAWQCGTDISCLPNCGPTNDWECDTLDSTGTVGLFPSLFIDKALSNNPRIAYYDRTNGKLKYALIPGGGTLGNCGPLFLGVQYWQCDSIASMGPSLSGNLGISLALDPFGKPLIAYLDASEALGPTRLRVAQPRYVPGLGNCGPLYNWECTTVDGGGSWTNEGSFASLAFTAAGKPIIAYYEEDNYYDGNLKVAAPWEHLFLPLISR